MSKQRSRKLLESDKFREVVHQLVRRTDVEWKHYEENFLHTQVRRPGDYIFSDDQRKVLNRLMAVATTFAQYSEFSVRELFVMTYPHRAELHESDEEFLTRHFLAGTTALAVREIRYLAGLYRHREPLQRDERVEEVFRETWTDETSLADYGDLPSRLAGAA
jgi:hypothetical protein